MAKKNYAQQYIYTYNIFDIKTRQYNMDTIQAALGKLPFGYQSKINQQLYKFGKYISKKKMHFKGFFLL